MLRHSHSASINDQNNPLVEKIRAIFYNGLVMATLNETNISEENIDEKMKAQIRTTIINILENSMQQTNCILLPTNDKVNEKNCPTIYMILVKALLQIKPTFDQLSQEEINLIKQHNVDNHQLSLIETMIHTLADKIIGFPQFKEMLPKAKEFILEALGLKTIPVINLPLRKLDETGITPTLIRQSFYNEMVNQCLEAIEKNWITLEDLQSEEAYIFLALPALTLIEAIYQSKDYNGIRLLNDKLLTKNNCPTEEKFQDLFIPIINEKSKMTAKSEPELALIKMMCLQNNYVIPQAFESLKPSVSHCAAVINEISSLISRRRIFHETIEKVIQTCIDTLSYQPQQLTR